MTHVLAELEDALSRNGVASPSHISTLDAICRKLAVTGTLCGAYDANWRTSRGTAPLAIELWPRVIRVLLVSARGAAVLQDRARSLKWLNAAFTALDAAARASSVDAALKAEAAELLASLTDR